MTSCSTVERVVFHPDPQLLPCLENAAHSKQQQTEFRTQKNGTFSGAFYSVSVPAQCFSYVFIANISSFVDQFVFKTTFLEYHHIGLQTHIE